MFIIGVDPGRKGALVAIDAANAEIAAKMVMPFDDDGDLDLYKINAFLSAHLPLKVFIEKSQAMPGNGATSMYNYGFHNGQLVTLCRLRTSMLFEVRPSTWCKGLGWDKVWDGTRELEGKEKSASIAQMLIWPGESFIASPRSKKPHDGMVDAALIAYYGYRLLKR